MEQDKRYYAFISYKREDERWAKWLQHRLEHYKLPSNLNGRTDLPREIRPVFRDTAELNPGNLPQQIHDALTTSRHLIVVCSPRSAASPWVNREIEAFIAMGKQDRIIPFIVDGRPMADDPGEECFPQAIRDLPKEQELLGANVNEMGRDAAAVKTVAQMFGVRFDTLWKRYEREQKRKRAMVVAAVALFVLAVLTVAGVILRQNTVINKSRADLQVAYDNLSAANRKTEAERARAEHERDRAEQAEDSIRVQYSIIEQANDDLRRTNDARAQAQSRAAAEAAMKLVEEGDNYLARKVALAAWDISPTKEAEAALRHACAYNNAILRGHKESVADIAISPDGRFVASGSSDSTVRIWDVETGKLMKILMGHKQRVSSVTFSTDGKQIVSTSVSGCLIWDRASGNLINKFSPGGRCASFCPDGSMLIVGNERELMCFDAVKGGIKWRKWYSACSVVFSKDGKEIIAALPGGIIATIDVSTGQLIGYMYDGGHVRHVSFGSDGNRLFSTSGYSARIRDFSSKEIKDIEIGWEKCADSACAFSLDGNQYVTFDINHAPWVYNVIDEEWRKVPGRHNLEVTSAVFSPDDKQILSSSDDGIIRLWDVSNGAYLKTMGLRLDHDALEEIKNKEEEYDRRLVWRGGRWSGFMSKNKKYRILYNGTTIRIVDVKSGKKLHSWDHPDYFSFCTDSPNSNIILTLAWSNDTNDMCYIRIWDVESGICLQVQELDGRYSPREIIYADFFQDGKSVKIIVESGKIYILNIPPLEDLIKETSERFKDNPLTAEERRRYYLE